MSVINIAGREFIFCTLDYLVLSRAKIAKGLKIKCKVKGKIVSCEASFNQKLQTSYNQINWMDSYAEAAPSILLSSFVEADPSMCFSISSRLALVALIPCCLALGSAAS